MFRVPLLLQRVAAVLHRQDVAATAAFDPPGVDASGYDDDFREPVVYGTPPARASSRQELPAVRVPCQVETDVFRALGQTPAGNAEDAQLVLVTHRRDLDRLGLIDANTKTPTVRVNDRVSALERLNSPGSAVQTFPELGLYVREVRPVSWGFGPDGHDLELLVLGARLQAT